MTLTFFGQKYCDKWYNKYMKTKKMYGVKKITQTSAQKSLNSKKRPFVADSIVVKKKFGKMR